MYYSISTQYNTKQQTWETWVQLSTVNTMYVQSVLYTNIDLKLQDKSHGPMHYQIGVTCVSMDTGVILCCNNTIM